MASMLICHKCSRRGLGASSRRKELKYDLIDDANKVGAEGYGQGADLLENRGWDGLSDRVIEISCSASRSFLTASS